MSLFGDDTALVELQNGIREIADKIRSLESAQKHLELEWEELYDKVRRQMARMSKRAAVDVKENGEDPAPEAITQYDHLDPISKSIMLRRAGIVGQ